MFTYNGIHTKCAKLLKLRFYLLKKKILLSWPSFCAHSFTKKSGRKKVELHVNLKTVPVSGRNIEEYYMKTQ